MSARMINHLLWVAEHPDQVVERSDAGFPIPASEIEKIAMLLASADLKDSNTKEAA